MKFWKKAGGPQAVRAEDLLRRREPYCVGAASRFLARTSRDYLWIARNQPALLIYSRRTLYPVFDFSPGTAGEFLAGGIPLPSFFELLRDLHAMQGLAEDMDLVETALDRQDIFASERCEYELRRLDISGGEKPGEWALRKSPKIPLGLVIRAPSQDDLDALFPLQQGYEYEEVLPRGGIFNPGACRKGLEYLLKTAMILVAELEGRLAGKINVNALSFTRFQIGGVYVVPEYRNLGIAQAMTAALIEKLSPQKKNFSLFVKKANVPACRAYDKTGFVKIADYRISYYLPPAFRRFP